MTTSKPQLCVQKKNMWSHISWRQDHIHSNWDHLGEARPSQGGGQPAHAGPRASPHSAPSNPPAYEWLSKENVTSCSHWRDCASLWSQPALGAHPAGCPTDRCLTCPPSPVTTGEATGCSRLPAPGNSPAEGSPVLASWAGPARQGLKAPCAAVPEKWPGLSGPGCQHTSVANSQERGRLWGATELPDQ